MEIRFWNKKCNVSIQTHTTQIENSICKTLVNTYEFLAFTILLHIKLNKKIKENGL